MSSSNVLRRLNCKAVNSTISVQILEVRDLPEVYDDIPMVIELVRSSKNSVKSKALIPYDWVSRPQDPLSVSATLYRDPKGTCLTKPVTMKLSDSRSGKILAEFKFDAASFVIAPNTTPRSLDLKANKGSKMKSVHLRLQISSVLGGDKSSADEISTIQSGMSPEDNDLSGFSIMEFEDDEEDPNNGGGQKVEGTDSILNGIDGVVDVLDEEETLDTAKQAIIENERLKEELRKMKEAADREKAETARKLAELENEVDRLQSESMSRQSISSYSGSRASSFSGAEMRGRMNSLVSEVNSNVFELSAAADKASRLPPQAIVGQWVTVEGKGLGKVLAFHKEWTPGTNSKRKYSHFIHLCLLMISSHHFHSSFSFRYNRVWRSLGWLGWWETSVIDRKGFVEKVQVVSSD